MTKDSDILTFAIASKKLAIDEDTKFMDGRTNGPSPADFGEHKEIPAAAMAVIPVESEAKSLEHVEAEDLLDLGIPFERGLNA